MRTDFVRSYRCPSLTAGNFLFPSYRKKRDIKSNVKKIRFHPIFAALCIFSVISGKLTPLIDALFALAVHEFSHFLSAKSKGFVPDGFCLTPFGATMSYDCGLSDKDEFFVTLAGPCSNLVCCLFCAALWWFCPESYRFSRGFFDASFALAVFNLLPVFPFDGGRLLLSLSKNKIRFLRKNRIFGFVLSALILAAGVYSAISGYGFTLIFAAAVILWSNIFDAPKERYRVIFSSHGVFSSPYAPYEKRDVFVDGRAKTGELLRFLTHKGIHRGNVKYRVHVTDGKKEILLSEENLEKLFFKDRKTPLTEVISTLPLPDNTSRVSDSCRRQRRLLSQ